MDLETARETARNLTFVDWGLIGYAEALGRQLDLVEKRQRKEIPDVIVFCSHPPVVTLGRGTKKEDVFGWTGEIHEIQRGGRATYHGPGQLIGYPILDLKNHGSDLHKYMRRLENAVISTLAEYDVVASGDIQDATGVWVGSKKIASIGIGVKKWVSYHGFALNLHRDEQAFQGINPCGFSRDQMTSLEELIGAKVLHTDFQQILSQRLAIAFQV